MNDYNYYPHEKKLIHIIDYLFNENSIFYITGDSGCGKSFTLKSYLSDNYSGYLFLYFAGDYLHNDKDYYPFLAGLSSKTVENNSKNLQKGLIELTKDIPFIPNISTYIAESFVNKTNSFMLNPIEQEIFSKIYFLIRNRKVIFFLDDLHWWDKRSIQLLDIIIRQIDFSNLQNNLKLFLGITPNQSTIHKQYIDNIISNMDIKHIEFPTLKFQEFKSIINVYLHLDDSSEKQLNILYNLINNHMKVLAEVIKELKRGKSILAFENESGKEYLNELLESRLNEYGATGQLISKVLEYASIIGLSFSYFELEKITRINSKEFKSIISHAKELELIESTSEKDIASFAHQIIRELFESRMKSNDMEYLYYLTIEQCISQIKPSEFLRRARYLVKAGELERAANLYVLDSLQQLRNYNEISSENKVEAAPLISEELLWYLEHMKEAYRFHNEKDYEAAIEELNLIEEFYSPSLIAEKHLLESFCYTKSLDKNIREKSLECIKQFDSLEAVDGEIEIYERIQNRLVSIYAHLGRLKEASDAEDRLMQSLRFRYQYDENARIRLNIVRRTYNIVHDCKASKVFMKKAVDYFGVYDAVSIPNNLKHYYISLVNYSSILTLNGMFREGNEYMKKALELETNFKEFVFPRQQILYNNFLVNSYLCDEMELSECIESLKGIISKLPLIAERLTYTSNLSVFFALDNKVDEAKKILLDEIKAQNVEHDVEGFYKFRSYTNLAIYQYLLGEKNNAIERLSMIENIISTLNNSIYYQKHHEIITQIIYSFQNISPKDWWTCVHSIMPTFKTDAWKFFGAGYVLASLFNWDTEN